LVENYTHKMNRKDGSILPLIEKCNVEQIGLSFQKIKTKKEKI